MSRCRTIQHSSVRLSSAGALDGMDWGNEINAEELRQHYLEDVCRYVVRHVNRADEAEDIIAEVFAAATAGLRRFRGQCPARLWLLSIARRKIVDAHRRRAARCEILFSELEADASGAATSWEEMATAAGPESVVMRAEAQRVVRGLLDELTAEQREAVLLQYVERLSVAEIAVVMGRSVASVTGLLQRARAAIYRRGREYFLGSDEVHE